MKVRCSGDTPQCTNCQRRNKQCTYASKAGPSPTEASSSRDDSASASASQTTVSPEIQRSSIASSSQSNTLGSTVDQDTPSLSDELVIGLVSLYFDRLYPLPSYSFLHQATVIQRCRDKSIDHALELAICSITAIHFDAYQDERDDWAQEAEHLILERLEDPSIFKIQASLLLIRYRAAVGQFPRAFIMAGLAARWAAALRLNYEHSKLSPVAQEVRRRTFWSLYLLEDSFCVGLKEFELFDPEIIYLQLPCEDEDFYQERHVATGYLQPGKGLEPEVLGSRAAFVRLAFIRRAIIRLNRRISLKEINISEVFSSMERFQNDLLRLKTKLAPHDQYPLSKYPESTPHASIESISVSEKASMKEKCISHAEEIVNILSAFVKHKDEKDTLEFDAAICAYHSARLLLFGAYTGGNNTGLLMQTAISKAQLCLDVITRYFDFSAQLKSMRQELERVIQQHKLWLESSGPGAVTTPDQASSSKLSKDAYNRQRLAIHSLLRQSDFVDDSSDAAPEPPSEPAYGGGLDLNAWACGTPGTQDLTGYLTDVDEQYMY
ncbi:uncharacterized protein QYS62_007047 [Fusarium acuminatum]|uniref:Transcription factor domain-containing protein n=1 Tax=Fusarium acuminatum TaxID=5515 RepID=A0ABZ2WYU7_9HYPO